MTIRIADLSPVVLSIFAVLCQSSLRPALAGKLESTRASDSGYELMQFDTETDKTTIQLSRLGLKVTNLKGGTVIVCTPPKWEVIAYSIRAKRICRSDLRHFTGEYRLFYTLFQKPGFSDVLLDKKPTSSTVLGLPVDCYHSTAAFEKKQLATYHAGDLRGNDPGSVDYCTCRKLPSTPQMEFVLRRMYGLPNAPGVPISLNYHRVDTQACSELETLRVTPKRYTSQDFKIPSGLQQVESIAALRADQISVDRAAEFVDSVSRFKMH